MRRTNLHARLDRLDEGMAKRGPTLHDVAAAAMRRILAASQTNPEIYRLVRELANRVPRGVWIGDVPEFRAEAERIAAMMEAAERGRG